jgi:hypothetical protein
MHPASCQPTQNSRDTPGGGLLAAVQHHKQWQTLTVIKEWSNAGQIPVKL